MSRRSLQIASLLFFSGLCALIYQVAWLRELRLVFGASTPASAAVLAVFMGGLGAGSLLLGARAERAERPLAMYADLELGIAVTSALTPGLLWLARSGYIAMGGSVALGLGAGTVVRLLLAALVLLPPTLLMGGTLPAAARAAIGEDDAGRRSTALLYGLNTLGAVTGAALSTFIMLEVFGTRLTLWLGCLVNALVALTARALARSFAASDEAARLEAQRKLEAAAEEPNKAVELLQTLESVVLPPEAFEAAGSPAGASVDSQPSPPEPAIAVEEAAPDSRPGDAVAARLGPLKPFVLVAAAGSGFVFLLMELVWYRMLGPLLGGSSYTFGLILAVALLGIGLGGLLYTRRGSQPVMLGAFALSCGLEALCMAIPLALGDRIAWLAMFLRTMGSSGLAGHAVAWTIVTAIVVLPPALVAGYQFPLLIALLGRGGADVGRHVGQAYACNTAGAIAGSLAGGFVVLPLVGAVGVWKLTIWMLVVLGGVALVLHLRAETREPRSTLALPLSAVLASVLLVHLTEGPTALWRHTPIGAGRADDHAHGATRNSMRATRHERNRAVWWELDGRESSIALVNLGDRAFLVNGKSDGAAVADGGTQVMGGLLGALLHPTGVKRALVVGLGTGSTAGWLGALPDIERVDVVELEPAMVRVAAASADVNRRVLDNPKVNLVIGDAREVLLTTPHKYDLIFSEPSNPYRAGIASLFTREFYQAVRQRLQPGGMLVQWVQAYEIDAASVRTIFATLAGTFGSVEAWRTKYSDLVLVSRAQDQPFDVAQARRRIVEEPYKEALMSTWRADTVESLLAHYVAGPGLARAIVKQRGELDVNTDDRNLLEFSVARAVGRPQDFNVDVAVAAATERGEDRPLFVGGGERSIDWAEVYDAMISMRLVEGNAPAAPASARMNKAMQRRRRAQAAWLRGDMPLLLRLWEGQPKPPTNPVEVMTVAYGYAAVGNGERARPLIARLRRRVLVEPDAIEARLLLSEHKPREAWQALSRALLAYRGYPWANAHLMHLTVRLALEIARTERDLLPAILEVMKVDWSEDMLRYVRQDLRLELSLMAADPGACVAALEEFGRWVPWERAFLERRLQCYERANHPRRDQARRDLVDFIDQDGSDFGDGLRPASPRPPRAVPVGPKPSPPAPPVTGSDSGGPTAPAQAP